MERFGFERLRPFLQPVALERHALVLVYPTFTIPFCSWLLMGFFKALPVEIEEAAIADGCSLFGAFIKKAAPLSVPAILTVVIFTFTLRGCCLQPAPRSLHRRHHRRRRQVAASVKTHTAVVPDLTFCSDIKLNPRLRLHRDHERLTSPHRTLPLVRVQRGEAVAPIYSARRLRLM
ncbi:ABC transporter permease subunit [Bradyrhizobium sp. Gha]|uniref:ABC transporter permease subunit n=1 Tax=Bradyrhizobium sp. Gha TaxID=1855318 RepID=UPI000ACB1250|nr:ABC transporter permease subunit [Bradyrhizobium sp. Gha]